jgi:hypothetical protein
MRWKADVVRFLIQEKNSEKNVFFGRNQGMFVNFAQNSKKAKISKT